MERLLKAREAAKILGVNVNRLYTLAKQGEVPSVHIGNRVRFSEDELREWIKNGGTKG